MLGIEIDRIARPAGLRVDRRWFILAHIHLGIFLPTNRTCRSGMITLCMGISLSLSLSIILISISPNKLGPLMNEQTC